jgi:hypothetical protein
MQQHVGILHLQIIELVVVASAGCHFCPLRDQGFDQRFADAVATPGDHNHFILKERHE